MDFKLAFFYPDREISRSIMEQDISESAYFFNLGAWFDKNKKQVAWGAVGVVAAAAVVGFVVWSQQEKAERAGQELSSALVARSLSRTESPDAMLKVATTYPGTAAGAQALLLGAGELSAGTKLAEARTQFECFLREYPAHPLAAQANLGVAASLAADGKLDEAANGYKSLVVQVPNYEIQGKLAPAMGLQRGARQSRVEVGPPRRDFHIAQ